jgi:hypothetical protein
MFVLFLRMMCSKVPYGRTSGLALSIPMLARVHQAKDGGDCRQHLKHSGSRGAECTC